MSSFPSEMEQQAPKAPQACAACRRQKRKCSKSLPKCELCTRMDRMCDYSNAAPAPSADDFNALRLKLAELESRFGMQNGTPSLQTPYTPNSNALAVPDAASQALQSYTPPSQDIPWQNIQNRFPAIAFLDKQSFKYGGFTIPQPSVDIPIDVLEILGDGPSVRAVMTEYFSTFHKWMPIVSSKRIDRNMVNPSWEGGPDLALLFLAMKLVISKPQDGLESSQSSLYISAKRFITLMEATGTASLLVLQASILVAWYEFGQVIYPAASMSAGWCVKYGNMLGINGHPQAAVLLRNPDTWTEQEERKRTWWGVLIIDRVVSIGSQGYILNSQEPSNESTLPVNDEAWDAGGISDVVQKLVSNPVADYVSAFPRLCQAYMIMGKVLSHIHGPTIPSETAQFGLASQLYLDIQILTQHIIEEATTSKDYLSFTPALALSFSAQYNLCLNFTCPISDPSTTEAAEMKVKSTEGLRAVSESILTFAQQIDTFTPMPQDLDRISPIIMDALYYAAVNSAWQVRESGSDHFQMALGAMRSTLHRLGARWRNASEYLRILDAQEFQYTVSTRGT